MKIKIFNWCFFLHVNIILEENYIIFFQKEPVLSTDKLVLSEENWVYQKETRLSLDKLKFLL